MNNCVDEIFNDIIELYDNGDRFTQITIVDKCFSILKSALPESEARKMLIKIQKSIVR